MRISEVYKSVQGEGPRVGEVTIFVRFAGCNLRCPGWPCDTQHAIDPSKYRSEWKSYKYDELASLICTVDLKPDGTPPEQYSNICFTGGEPFLQSSEELKQLVDLLITVGYTTFEVFTNGILEHPVWQRELLYKVMDWKLEGSGESFSPEAEDGRWSNLMQLEGGDAVKYVIKSRDDFEEARDHWEEYCVKADDGAYNIVVHNRPIFFYGAVWGEIENEGLVDWVLTDGLPWRLNVQQHNYIWPREERAR